jgi:hypothetical protein
MPKAQDRLKADMRRARESVESFAEMAREHLDLYATGLINEEQLDQVVKLLKVQRQVYDKAQMDYLADVPY